jgi:spermidine synthase
MRAAVNRTTWIVSPLVFGSGLCALIYQVVWTRELRFVFGASTAASSAVIAIFIAGLGFGGLWFGRRVERNPRPLELYARLELGIAAWCALTPALLALIRMLYSWSGGSVSLGNTGSTLVRLVLASLVLGPATFLMGGTLPAMSRAVETDQDVARRSVALIYGVNTLGAVVGCALSTFVMLEQLGGRATLYTAVALNLLVAFAAWRVAHKLLAASGAPDKAGRSRARRSRSGRSESKSRREGGRADPRESGPEARESQTELASALEPAAPPALIYASAAVVGFAFFLMELVWYRMLGPLLGGTIFTFGLILTIALAGIGLGSALYAALLSSRRFMLIGFALTCALEAAWIALPYALGDRVAIWAVLLRPSDALTLSGLVPGWSLITLLVVFPAAFVSGVQFPLLIALLGGGRTHVGRDVGAAYAANTLGAIAGALAGGFGLLPALGALGCWRLVSGLLAVWGTVIAVLAIARDGSKLTAASVFVVAALTAALVVLAEGPTAAWRHSPIGAGRVPRESVETPNAAASFRRSQRRSVDWETDGLESTIAIDHSDGISFIVNGKSDGNAREDAATQVMGGLLGAAFVPRVNNAMVIGLGTGSTAGWLARLPEVQRVDVAEIEPAMAQVAKRCASVNQAALDNPKLHVHRGDARELLAVSRASYDVIFSEPSNPYRAGIASLYTREFYEAIRRRMTSEGVFVQWMQGYDVDDATMRTIYATLAAVFPHVETWDGMRNDLLLVASLHARVHDPAVVRARLTREPFVSAQRVAWSSDSLEGFYGHFVANDAFTRAMAEESEAINTDDRSPVEFGFARNLRGARPADEWALDTARARNQHRPALRGAALDWGRVDWEREAFTYFATGRARPELLNDGERGRLEALSRWANSDFSGALSAWRAAEVSGVNAPTQIERWMLAELLAHAGESSDEARVSELAREEPTLAGALRAVWLARHGRRAQATEVLGVALREYRTDPWPIRAPMARAIDSVMRLTAASDGELAPRWLDALSQPFAVHVNEAARQHAQVRIAWALGPKHRACVDVLSKFEPNVDWTESMLDFRSACYAAHAHPLRERAADDLARFRANAAAQSL